MSAVRFLRLLDERGVRRVVYTDVARDGMLGGPNLEELHELAESTSIEMVLSGGVGTLDDLRRVARVAPSNVVGVIIGRALYDGAFELRQAQDVVRG